MAVNFFSDVWDREDLMYVTVTGMFLTNCTFKASVGELPKIDFTMNVNIFLQKLSEEELDEIKKLITKLQLSKLEIKEPKEILIQIGNGKLKGSGTWVIPP